MDAKPQRAFRPPPAVNNENMAPMLFLNNQRQKPGDAPVFKDAGIVAVKIPAKRTAFGDVSNVVRPLAISAAHASKAIAATTAISSKTGYLSTAPMPVPAPPPATYSRDTSAQPQLQFATNANVGAPAERPQTSAPLTLASDAAFASGSSQTALRPAPVSSTAMAPPAPLAPVDAKESSWDGQAARKPSVVFSSEIEFRGAPAVHPPAANTAADAHFAGSAAAGTWDKPKRSPRHSKSQPCLKNADGLAQQQKQHLRRTLSRLPVDRSAFQDLDILADSGPTRITGGTSAPASAVDPGKEAPDAHLTAQPVSMLDTAVAYDAQPLHALEEREYAGDAPFVDAVEDFHNMALPPLPSDTDEDVRRLRQEVEAAAIVSEDGKQLGFSQSRFVPATQGEAPAADYLSDMPAAATVASALSAEVEESWDDDADFYDDQAYTTAHSFRSLGDNTTGGLTTVVMPKVTAKIQNELDAARAMVEATTSPDDLDEEAWDISMVAEYGDDIYGYMKELEAKMLPNPYYMDSQTEIQWSMRAVLMEWLIQVHARFNLLPETLFLTVNYIDRFLSSKIVSVARLQLVGATAIFIAAKYEEITCPSIQEIVYMVDGGYTKDEILKAERFMLSMLGFELGWPGPMSFLRRISKADDYDLDTRTLAKYFLEVTIMDERFVACPPSFLAAGAHCLARMMLFKGDWTPAHTHYSGYTWSQIRPLANTILHCCRDPTTHHAAVYEKYASNKFKKASTYVEEELRQGFLLPPLHAHPHSRHRLSQTESLADSMADSSAPLRSAHPDQLVYTES